LYPFAPDSKRLGSKEVQIIRTNIIFTIKNVCCHFKGVLQQQDGVSTGRKRASRIAMIRVTWWTIDDNKITNWEQIFMIEENAAFFFLNSL
jgi:hypothetical protein